MKRMQLAVTILCLAGWAGVVQAQETVNITYKPLKPGEVVRTRLGTNVVGTISGMGPGSQNMTQKNGHWMKMECLDVDEAGVTTVRLTFERMAMTMNAGPLTMDYDSADKDAAASQASAFNPAARMFEAMIGKSITARIDAQGKPVEVSGFKDLMNEVFEQMPGGRQTAKMMESILSDDTIMQNFGHTSWLPKTPVKIGETWPSQQEMPMGPMGKMVMKSKNKLIGIETVNGRRCARVATTINMEMGTDKPYEVGGMQMQTHMTSTGGTGSWLWDIDRGRIVQMKNVAPMEMTISTQATASQSQPAPPVRMVQKMTYSTVMEEVEGDPNKPATKANTSQPSAEPSTPKETTTPAPAAQKP